MTSAVVATHSSGAPQEGDTNSNTNNNNNNNEKKKNEEDNSRKDWTLLSQGAEARIWKVPNQFTTTTTTSASASSTTTTTTLSNSSWMIVKERFAKSYRHHILDERLTKQRCRAEGRLLETCHQQQQPQQHDGTQHERRHRNGASWWSVPAVLRIDPPLLYLEYLSDHITVREYLDRMLLPRRLETTTNGDKNITTPTTTTKHDTNDKKQQQQQQLHYYSNDDQDRLLELANTMGMVIAQLHNLKIVHGDLTTSNMMIMTTTMMTTANNNNNNNDHPPVSQSHPSRRRKKLVLIDFGLAKRTESAEERAVDLYVLERALLATHPRLGASLVGASSVVVVENDPDQTKDKDNNNDNNHDTMNEDETNPDPDHDDEHAEWGIKNEERKEPNKEEQQESGDFLTCLWTAYEREAHKAKATMNRLYQVRQRGRKRECFG